MREADGRMQKVESSIDAAVRFLEAKMRDNPEQKKVSEMVWLGFEDAAVWSSVCRTVTVQRMSMSNFPFPAYSCK